MEMLGYNVSREMEERYGHYFDMIIIYSDPDR
jgi:hypothetical protein